MKFEDDTAIIDLSEADIATDGVIATDDMFGPVETGNLKIAADTPDDTAAKPGRIDRNREVQALEQSSAEESQSGDLFDLSGNGEVTSLTTRIGAEGSATVFIAPAVSGEFTVALCQLQDWQKGFRSALDPTRRDGRGLCEAARTPAALAPLAVMTIGNRLVVVDGTIRLAMLRKNHGAESDIPVRVFQFEGSEVDAVRNQLISKMCSITITPIEQARLVRHGYEALDIQKSAYAVMLDLSGAKLTRLLTVAHLETTAPQFFELLKNPPKAPIDFGYTVGKAYMVAEKADRDQPPRGNKIGAVAKLLSRCEALLLKDERYDPATALAKLDIGQRATPRKAMTAREEKPSSVQTLSTEPIVLRDREIGAIELLSDHVPRARLPENLLNLSQQAYDEIAEAWLQSVRGWFETRRPHV